jgi:Transposase IS116/IS110/IS902 family
VSAKSSSTADPGADNKPSRPDLASSGGAGCGDRRGLPAWHYQIELQTIPGVGETVAQVIAAEAGADMSRFSTAAHLAAWAGLAPATNESARKQSPAGKRHGNKWLTAMLVEAAGSWVGCRARTICPPNMPGCQTARDAPSPGCHRPLDSRVGALDVDP